MDFKALFQYSGILIAVYILCIVLHEIGHMIIYQVYNGKNKLQITYGKYWFPITYRLNIDDIPPEAQMLTLISGIVVGALPILFLFDYGFYFILLLLIPYYAGIRNDISEIFNIIGCLRKIQKVKGETENE